MPDNDDIQPDPPPPEPEEPYPDPPPPGSMPPANEPGLPATMPFGGEIGARGRQARVGPRRGAGSERGHQAAPVP